VATRFLFSCAWTNLVVASFLALAIIGVAFKGSLVDAAVNAPPPLAAPQSSNMPAGLAITVEVIGRTVLRVGLTGAGRAVVLHSGRAAVRARGIVTVNRAPHTDR